MIQFLITLVNYILKLIYGFFAFSFIVGQWLVGAISKLGWLLSGLLNGLFILGKDFGLFASDIEGNLKSVTQYTVRCLEASLSGLVGFVLNTAHCIVAACTKTKYFSSHLIRGCASFICNVAVVLLDSLVLLGQWTVELVMFAPRSVFCGIIALLDAIVIGVSEAVLLVMNCVNYLLHHLIYLGIAVFTLYLLIRHRRRIIQGFYRIYLRIRLKLCSGQSSNRQYSPPFESACVACRSNEKVIVLLPCRHLCVCEECFVQLSNWCPICRCIYESQIRIYR